MVTIVFGAIGVLASQDLGRLAGYCVLVSSGTLLAVIGTGHAGADRRRAVLPGQFDPGARRVLPADRTGRARPHAGADMLAVTLEAFGEADDERPHAEEEIGVAIPATMAILGLAFLGCALLLAGLPPLSGFLAKFALLAALFDPRGFAAGAIPRVSWVLLAVLLLSGLAALIAMTRAGIRTFWTPLGRSVPRVRIIEMAPVALLLLLCVGADGAGRAGAGLHAGDRAGAAGAACLRRGRAGGAADHRGGRAMTRWLPFPRVSVALLAAWLLLNQSLAPAQVLFGALLALALPRLLLALRHARDGAQRPRAALRLAARVALDIIRSNLAVGGDPAAPAAAAAARRIRAHSARPAQSERAGRARLHHHRDAGHDLGRLRPVRGRAADPRARPGRRGRLGAHHQASATNSLLMEIFA